MRTTTNRAYDLRPDGSPYRVNGYACTKAEYNKPFQTRPVAFRASAPVSNAEALEMRIRALPARLQPFARQRLADGYDATFALAEAMAEGFVSAGGSPAPAIGRPESAEGISGLSSEDISALLADGMSLDDHRDLEKTSSVLKGFSNMLAGIYAKKTGKSVDEMLALMDAETWFFGREAVDAGFADELAASASTSVFSGKAQALSRAQTAFTASTQALQASGLRDDYEQIAALLAPSASPATGMTAAQVSEFNTLAAKVGLPLIALPHASEGQGLSAQDRGWLEKMGCSAADIADADRKERERNAARMPTAEDVSSLRKMGLSDSEIFA